MVEIKFCGLTRAEDTEAAAACGADYAGVIFAHGPRLVDVARAKEVLAPLRGGPVRRVGVFGRQDPAEIVRVADAVALHVVQLHDGAGPDALLMLRERFDGAIWLVLGVSGALVPALDDAAARALDAVVLDTSAGGRSGGTGVAFDWAGARAGVERVRERTRVVLAGGLRPSTVAEAVRVLSPDVVDVSSGVESSPGIKDPELMRAFAMAARPREER